MPNKTINQILKYKQICLYLNMANQFEIYKGLHPGELVAHLLEKRGISQRAFSLTLPEHVQTFNAILKGKRSLNIPLSLKIEKALNLEEGMLMTLQVYYDIKQERMRTQNPGPKLRKILFWDSDMSKVDWEEHGDSIIRRVYERGTEEERNEIDRYYGPERVKKVIEGLPMMESGNLVLMPHLRR